MSRKPGGWSGDQVLSEYWGARSEALGVENGLQGVIHCRERRLVRRKQGREEGRMGGVVEMRVAAPFFTADKNICRDINLKLRSSLPLLPHHPSSFRTNHHLGTSPHSPSRTSPCNHPHMHTQALPFPPTFIHNRILFAISCSSTKHTWGNTHWKQCHASKQDRKA